MHSGKSILTIVCAVLALGFLVAGLVMIISCAPHLDDPGVLHEQHIGMGLTVGGAILIVGIMGAYYCFGKLNGGDGSDFQVV